MAENKKGFILYADLIHTISDLPNDTKGKLFQLILDYVNDLNPEPEDLILKVAFNPIKLQLKRDLKQWESKINQRRAAGKASAKSRSTKSTTVKSRSTKPTVIVNDNVNVTDKVIVKEINNNTAASLLVFPFTSEDFKVAWISWKDYKQKEFRFKYKSGASEQASLNQLKQMSRDEKTAINIIAQSMANGWKGFFPIKNSEEKKSKIDDTAKHQATESLIKKIDATVNPR